MSEALDLLAGLVLEDGARWGERAVPWQWADVSHVLDPESREPYSFLTRARGGSKTSDLAGVTIAAMLAQAPRGARLYGLAADRDQGRLLVDAVAGFAARTPELAGALDVQAYRVASIRTGAVLDVLAADAPGAWGLRPWFTVVDEVGQWADTPSSRRLWEATSSAVAKVGGARLVVLTTASSPAHWSAKLREHARDDPLWHLHEVPGPPPWLDPARLAEQRRRLPESVYLRLFENEWTAADDVLAAPEDLAACVTLDGPLPPQAGRRYVIGLDVGLKADATVAAVCHAERVVRGEPGIEQTVGRRVVLDRMERWQGSRAHPVRLQEVEDWLAATSQAYFGARLRYDPFQAIGSAQRLQARGVRVDEYAFAPRSIARLASGLLGLIREHALDLPDDPGLLDELAHVRVRETTPGMLRLDHDPDRHDDRAIALALAVSVLLDEPIGNPDAHVTVGGDGDWYGFLGPSVAPPLRYDSLL